MLTGSFLISFQNVQQLSALEAAVLLLPNVIAGISLNLITGFIACRISSYYLVLIANAAGIISPLLMCIINPSWNYWACAFWAVLLSPVSAGGKCPFCSNHTNFRQLTSLLVIFTIANLVITDAFPKETQALAGAMSNTAQQLGGAFGLALAGIVSAIGSEGRPEGTTDTLWHGYRAVFFMCFGAMAVSCILGSIALRKTGVVGKVKDTESPTSGGQDGEA